MDNRRLDIDGLRAIAVIGVVLFHLNVPGAAGGASGVDVFFVISGFLITSILHRQLETGNLDAGYFVARRIKRLCPALITVIALVCSFSLIVYSPIQLLALSERVPYALTFATNFYYFENINYFNNDPGLWPLLHTWSLGVEAQLYALWLFIAVLSARVSRRHAGSVFSCLAIILGGASLAYVLWALLHPGMGSPHGAAGLFYFPFSRVFEFAAGAVAFLVVNKVAFSIGRSRLLVYVGLGLVGLSLVFLDADPQHRPLWLLLPCLGTMFCIVGGTATSRSVLTFGPLVYLGRISYGIYLIHWPMISMTEYVTGGALSALSICIVLFATFALSAALHAFIELPFQVRRPRGNGPTFAQKGTLLFAILVSVAVPVTGNATSGFTNNEDVERVLNRSRELDVPVTDAFHFIYFGGAECEPPRADDPEYTVLAFGDSHAGALCNTLSNMFHGSDLHMFGSGDCSIYSDRYMIKQKLENAKCRSVRARAFERLNGGASILVVVQRWPQQLYMNTVARIGSEDEISFESPDDFVAFVAPEIESLKTRFDIEKLLVIGALPEFGRTGSPGECLQRFFNESCTTRNRTERDIVIAEAINDAFEEHAKNGAFLFVNPIPILCDDEVCNNFHDGEAIYSDDNHLSKRGARLLADQIRHQLQL